VLILGLFLSSLVSFAQMPKPALVGYWENWNSLKLTDLHDNYTVIQIAFAITESGTKYDMKFDNYGPYNKSEFIADVRVLQEELKVVILSIGGANHPVILTSQAEADIFVSSMNQIFEDFDYVFDGIDIDFEGSSMNFGNSWTIENPSASQQYLIDAIRDIQANYLTEKGKRMLLTMAPESVYLVGGLSTWQMNNVNGGAMLPIIEALNEEIDLLHVQFYNAGESVAIDGRTYSEGTGDYLVSVTESILYGFDLLQNKGYYSGFDASKFAIGLLANDCNSGESGFVEPTDVVKAVDYLRGFTGKPSGWIYNLREEYPELRGLMTWSVNGDKTGCSSVPSWEFAENFKNAFPEDVELALTERFEEVNFIIYPNPTSSELHLSSTSDFSTVEIYSVLGSKIETIEVSNNGIINLSDYPKGIYLLDINGSIQRIVKE